MVKRIILFLFVLTFISAIHATTFTQDGLKYETLPDYGCVLLGLEDPAQPVTDISLPPFACDGTKNYDIRKIADNAFMGVSSLETFSSHQSVGLEEIGMRAFSECSNLRQIQLYNVGKIGMGAFWDCINLQEAFFSPSLPEIPDFLFSGCRLLRYVAIGNDVTTIGKCAFQGCESFDWVTIPVSVTSIGDYAFSSCSKLQGVSFGPEEQESSLKHIGEGAFANCSNMYEISLPDNVETIGDMAFYCNHKLYKLIFGNKLKTIGKHCFESALHLNQITLPATLTEIGESAFGSTPLLENVTLLAAIPPTLGLSCFQTYNQPFFYVPEGTIEYYRNNESWSQYYNIVDGERSIIINMPNGVIILGNADKHPHSISLVPETGYKISTAMLGDIDITESITQNGRYEIPRLCDNQILNVTFKQVSTDIKSININQASIKVYANNGAINIIGLPENEVINLFSPNGTLVKTTNQHSIRCEKSVYIIKTSQGVFKTYVN